MQKLRILIIVAYMICTDNIAWDFIEKERLLHWTFDNPYEFGAFEHDASGKSNDGVVLWERIGGLGGFQWRPSAGLINGAGYLHKGVRGTISTKDKLSLPETWTLSILFKPLEDKTRFDKFFTFHEDKTRKNLLSFSQHKSFTLRVQNEGKEHILSFFKGKMSSEQWNHLVIVYEKGQVTFYLNGQSKTTPHTLAWNPKAKFYISLSGRNGTPHNRGEGYYDEFRIFKGALTAKEVVQLGDQAYLKSEPRQPVANAGMGYTTWFKEGGWFSRDMAIIQLQGSELIPGQNAGQTEYKWSILQQPEGGKAKFDDETDPSTELITYKPGNYILKLTASNATGADEARVHVAVFKRDQSPKKPELYTMPPERIEGQMVAIHPERVAALKGKTIQPISYWSFDTLIDGQFKASGAQAKTIAFDEKTMKVVQQGKIKGALQLGKNPLSLGQFDTLTNEFSASFWVYHGEGPVGGELLRVQGENNKHYWNNIYRKYRQEPDGSHVVDIIVKWWQGSTSVKPNNKWTHYVFTYSKIGHVRKLYVNGRLSVYNLYPLEKDASGKPSLLCNLKGAIIDDYALYDKTLNNEEVIKIFESANGATALNKRIAYDPYTSRVYRDDFIKQYFPEPTPSYQSKNFVEQRFDSENLAPYTHPRLNMTMEDLPRIRQAFQNSKQGSQNQAFMYLYTRTQFGQNLENYTPNSRLDEKKPAYAPKDMFQIDGKYVFHTHNSASSARIALALEALLTANEPLARKLIDQMMISAKLQQKSIDHWRSKDNPGWQHRYHNILGRRTTQMMYDYLYNWMTPNERKIIRKVIADATAGNWSIGMYAMPALYANRSNWQAWITGDMLIALQAIYGEDGFCQFTYDQAARAVNTCAEIMNDPESGAHYEGMGKSNINSTQMSVLSRMQPKGKKIISSKALYNNVAKFHLHIGLPWTNKIVMYDQKNGGNAQMPAASINVLHYAYPKDPILNYLKHAIEEGTFSYTKMRPSTFGQESWMISSVYTQDWTGPKDIREHLKQAVKEAGEPLGYFSDFRGQMISRSSWEADALQLNYVARVIKGGHHAPVKGYFVVNALERQWFEFRSRANHHSRTNSCVTVDGDGQDGTMARSLYYSGVAQKKDATFDILSSELTGAYRQINNKWPNLNYTRLKPDPRPWFNMPKQFLTNWYLGDRPYAAVYDDYDQFDPQNYKGKKEFAYAYRSS
ncbi:MAG: LamG domain-containing protein, partial [Lentisphaeria bacterium]|nr:LamG domain-containing protein [Lentisphaeria bacterium]